MLVETHVPSPFGYIKIKGSELGIQSVKFVSEAPPTPALVPEELQEAVRQLQQYFAAKRKIFELTLDWGTATEFNKSVWSALLQIPYGRTSSYSAIATKIGNPEAVRAVGLANRNNPIAIIVPCHRVLAKSGELHGYFYGLDMKRKLLELENPTSFAAQGSLF